MSLIALVIWKPSSEHAVHFILFMALIKEALDVLSFTVHPSFASMV
jgi:hypothetical protein